MACQEETIQEGFSSALRLEGDAAASRPYVRIYPHPRSFSDCQPGDLYYIYAQLRVETLLFSKDPGTERHLEDWSDYTMYEREAKASTYGQRLLQLFTVFRNGRASLAAGTVMASQ